MQGRPNFNPRPPCGRRPREQEIACIRSSISTHVPRAGDDRSTRSLSSVSVTFQPTSPVRETTRVIDLRIGRAMQFQPTSPVRETTQFKQEADALAQISTHVPRAGDDVLLQQMRGAGNDFNPRPPCGRRRVPQAGQRHGKNGFQPTSPVRETTSFTPSGRAKSYKFQPTSPVRETTSCQPSQHPPD